MKFYGRVIFLILLFPVCIANAQETIIKYLSGTDKDHTVNWDFYCTKGAKSGNWTKIPVPTNWEFQGFGGYNYGHEKNKQDEQGLYKHRFIANKNWANKQIELVFQGVMTDTEVKLNGQSVGPIHQGGFYEFSFNISPFIKPGVENTLEVSVSKMSADSSVNRAERDGDFWVFGGIYRPVYIRILPNSFIERVAIDAKANGQFNMDVFTNNCHVGDEIVAQVINNKGEKTGAIFKETIQTNTDPIRLTKLFDKPLLWNSEYPNMYQIQVSIKRKNATIHTLHQKFGFRTVEVRKNDGIYVNNTKVIFKGVDRHSFWPESGRTLSNQVHLLDIRLMKEMNMNAVRMSHYPPDVAFLDLCDSLGLFVLDELTGWQKKYNTPVGKKLVKELVTRDVNHPSILFWDNGNEGGWNTDLDNDYALFDPQQRTVLHPWNNFNNVDTKHYPDYAYIEKAAAKNDILLHTEMIHGLYDGGHGAGLDDYWNLMLKNQRHAGGFLWVLADEGIVRKDKQDSIDTYGNNAPDGILGPHREKEGSFYTIKEIWSPVQVKKPSLDKQFKGELSIENHYHFTSLSVCKFSWQLIKYPISRDIKIGHSLLSSGKTVSDLLPGKKGSIHLQLPANWQDADALTFLATDRNGMELYRWTWPIKSNSDILKQNLGKGNDEKMDLKETENGSFYIIQQNNLSYEFDIITGLIHQVKKNNLLIPFGVGPLLAGEKQTLLSFKHYRNEKGNLLVETLFKGTNSLQATWEFAKNQPVKLCYQFTEKDSANYYGIGFHIEEASITGMKWLGGGPYHVWKNRLKGVTVDVWHKKYNNTITGETFVYPEFKGYHSNMYWATIESKHGPFTVYIETPELYLQMMQPNKQKTRFNPFVNPGFPETNFSLLHAIAPIGTKFKGAETMGPQSLKNSPQNGVVSGIVWFDFR